jgi:hypothetical protein
LNFIGHRVDHLLQIPLPYICVLFLMREDGTSFVGSEESANCLLVDPPRPNALQWRRTSFPSNQMKAAICENFVDLRHQDESGCFVSTKADASDPWSFRSKEPWPGHAGYRADASASKYTCNLQNLHCLPRAPSTKGQAYHQCLGLGIQYETELFFSSMKLHCYHHLQTDISLCLQSHLVGQRHLHSNVSNF